MGTIDRLDFEISAKADKFTQAVDQATSKLDALAAKAQATASKVQGSNVGLADSYFHVVDRLKLAAAAVDRFGAQTDALTGKQHTAWTAIAGVVGGATGSMIERITRFVDAAQKASDNVSSGFDKMARSMWTSTDAMRVANDRLEISTAKIQNQRPNYLKLQLDEAREAADKLADSIQGDQQKATALLSQNHQSWWHTLLHQGTTANVEGTVGSMQQQLADAGNQQQVDLHRGDTGAAAKDRQSIDSGLKYLADKMTTTIADIDRDAKAGKGPDRKVERSDAVGVLAQTNARQDDLAVQDQSKIDAANNQRVSDAKESAEKRKAAAAAAAEAMRQAAEKQFQGFEDILNRRRAAEQVDAASEAAYWESLLGPAQKYSDNVSKVYARLGASQQGYYRELEEFAAKAVAAQKEDTAKSQEQLRILEELDKQWAEALHRDADAKAALLAVNVGNTSGMAELIAAHQAATGAITRYDAAQQLATLHASTYAAQLAAIVKEKQADDADSSLSPDQRKANQDTRDVKGAQIQGEADRTAYTDSQAEFYATGLGGATQALQEFMAAANDSAGQMKQFTTSSINGINDILLKLGSKNYNGQDFRRDIRNYGADQFRTLGGDGLRKSEAGIMGAFGLKMPGGKPDGSSSKPFYVKSVGDGSDILDKQGGSLMDKIKGLFGHGHAASAAQNAIYSQMSNYPTGSSTPSGSRGMSAAASMFSSATPAVASYLANRAMKPPTIDPSVYSSLAGPSPTTQQMGQMLFPNGAGDASSAGSPITSGSTTGGVIPASGVSKAFGNVIGVVPSFLKFFAGGTPPLSSDTMAMVGESGPEVLNLPKGTSVTPNGKWQSAMSGMGGHTINIHPGAIDARGATDPAEIEYRVNRAITKAAPHLVAASLQAHAERSKRSSGNK